MRDLKLYYGADVIFGEEITGSLGWYVFRLFTYPNFLEPKSESESV